MALRGTKDLLHLLKASHVLSVNRNKCGIISVDSSWSPLELAVDADREAIVFLSHALLSSQMPLTSLPQLSSTTSLSFLSLVTSELESS